MPGKKQPNRTFLRTIIRNVLAMGQDTEIDHKWLASEQADVLRHVQSFLGEQPNLREAMLAAEELMNRPGLDLAEDGLAESRQEMADLIQDHEEVLLELVVAVNRAHPELEEGRED